MSASREFLQKNASMVDDWLKAFFEKEITKANRIDPLAAKTITSLRDFCFGGKKVRGNLTILGYLILGGRNFKKIVPIASAIEIMHSSLLIHDDFIDHDLTRRGKPTMHISYGKDKGEHYGASMALMIGDIGIFLAHKIISESEFEANLKIKALSEFGNLLISTGLGELMDIDFDDKKDVTWEDLVKVRTYKTAYYTFVMPLSVGAILAGGGRDLLKTFQKYGEPVGIAFQITDDLLGVFGDSAKTKKSVDSDILEGKKTLLWAYFMKKANTAQIKYINRWYGSKKLTKIHIARIKKLLKDQKADYYCTQIAKDLVKKGKKELTGIKLVKYRQILADLADFVVERSA